MSEQSVSEILEIRPQIRFLWQVSEVLSALKEEASARFGRPFEYGYDGICLQQNRLRAVGEWVLLVDDYCCRINFSNEASLTEGVRFVFDLMKESENGFVLPRGEWRNGVRKEEK